jgi:hypothetical protein
MPVAGEVERTRPWRISLAVLFAILVAIPPFLGSSSSTGLAPVAAAIYALAPQQGDLAKPTSGVRPAQAWDLGVLARWSWFETKPRLAPASPQVRPGAADQP